MRKDIVVIGTSSGGIDALRSIASRLPKDFAAAIFAVMHTSANSPGVLAPLLSRSGPLPATCVRHQESIHQGRIYVPAPDHHLVVEPGIVRATRGPKENRFRPAIDPLFRSAANAYGARVVGVVLTGGLDDGTAGLRVVKQLGGIAVVQDPDDALYPSMPRSALKHVEVDHCVPLAEIPGLLTRLMREPAEQKGGVEMPEEIRIEVDIAKESNAIAAGVFKLGTPSNYACPECHGVLLQLKEQGLLRFRCHTGHAYSAESLLEEMRERTEASLWNALRGIEETVLLMRSLAEQIGGGRESPSSRELLRRASEVERRGALVRRAVLADETTAGDVTPDASPA